LVFSLQVCLQDKDVVMRFKLNKVSVIFYSIIMFMMMAVFTYFQKQEIHRVDSQAGLEKRVIKCELPLPNKLIQNLFFVASDMESARQMLFNSMKGIYFDNKLYIKTADFHGNNHVIPFENINCDSIGKQVSLTSNL